MSTRKDTSSDNYFVGVIKQAHNGPLKIVSVRAEDRDDAYAQLGALCSQLTPHDPEWAPETNPNLAWSVIGVSNVEDVRSIGSFSLSARLLHDNKIGNQPEASNVESITVQ